MFAHFDDSSLINHSDFVSIADGAETMRDDDGSLLLALLKCVDGLLDKPLTRCIKCRSRFIYSHSLFDNNRS